MMMLRHFPRAWEFTRFWQNEQKPGKSRYVPPLYDDGLPPDLEFPEHVRMPQTRGEENRFRREIQKSLVQAKRGQTVSAQYVFARLRRKVREIKEE